jgi:lipopolysaccharide export system protein LptA
VKAAILAAALLLPLIFPLHAGAQQLDLSHGGPIDITARDGIEWRQAEREVIATGAARAVRDNVTVTADRLIAWYRKKGGPDTTPAATPAAQPQSPGALMGDTDTGGNEIYRVEAAGSVHIFTQTDQAWGDKAIYDLDQSVLVMTGRNLRLVTPNDVVTARDSLEYWSQKHMAVARGDAVVVTSDGRRITADTLVAYTTASQAPQPGTTAVAAKSSLPGAAVTGDPLGASGKLERVEAFGHVSLRTATDTVTGDRAVYVTETGMARVGGTVQITRGQNQLNGAEADVNMKTGIARLVATHAGRVQGLVVPNDETNKGLTSTPAAPAPATAGTRK